jgi:hypothetical protein
MILSAWSDLNGPFAKFVLPAIATLIPAGITAALKWTQEHSRNRRSIVLTERISALAKSIHELPELPPATLSTGVTPQSALSVELDSALHELTVLQTRVRRGVSGVSTITAKLRAGMLLYRPKGWAATALHTAFFAYLFVFFFVLYAGLAPDSTATVSSAKTTSDFVTNLFAFLFIFGLAGIPPLILRHYAAKIHRRQCLEAQGKAPTAEVSPLASSAPFTSQSA